MSKEKLSRRKFLKYLGLSGAGIAFTSALDNGKEKIKAGGDDAKTEIENLKKAYEELDARSKLILRVMLVFTGLDIFI
jgi:hypothetical protein